MHTSLYDKKDLPTHLWLERLFPSFLCYKYVIARVVSTVKR